MSAQSPAASLQPHEHARSIPSSEGHLLLPTVEREVEFLSQGVRCRGLFVRPQAAVPAPLMILVTGLGGVYEMRLDFLARTVPVSTGSSTSKDVGG